jgi:UDP-2,3-diacylglucosamine hydrolase
VATLLISDLHLAPERPQTVDAFVAFLRGPARLADRLYILGDLFEVWIGDDGLDEGFSAGIAKELAAVSGGGTRVFFQHGNRDFLVGQRFAGAAGLELLAEEVVVPLHGRQALLVHGDQLCTDDLAYQAMRAQIRAPAAVAAFLARPLAERAAIARDYRRQSMAATAAKSEALMDVNPGAVAGAFRRHGVDLLIHGHTHRPARHEHVVDGRRCERWVLPDWHGRAVGIVVDPKGVRRADFDS